MKQQYILPIVLSAVIAGGAGFFAGTNYQQDKRSNFFQMNGGPGGTMMFRNGNGTGNGGTRGGFRPVAGTIIKADDTSITVSLPDGSSKIVLVSDKTTVNKATEVSKSDLTVGTRVAVFGNANNDGSINAQNIQLNPTRSDNRETPMPTPK